jgi:uncharacterized protein
MQTSASPPLGAAGDLGFLLDDFRDRVPHVAHILAMSADGLLITADDGLPRDAAERLAATCAGLLSLLRGAGQELGAGGLSHNMAEYADGYLFAMAVAPGPDAGRPSAGACVLMLADRDADLGLVSYELTALVNRVGDVLAPAVRPDPYALGAAIVGLAHPR